MKKQAFTLVELIVVITILAILGTIGFINLQGFSSSSRDSKRISELTEIRSGLQIYQARNGILPTPSEQSVTIGSGSTNLIIQGYAGESVLNEIRMNGDSKDPLDNNKYYTYSVNANKTKFQLLSLLENNDNLTSFNNLNIVSKTHASYENRHPYIVGNIVGIFLDETTNTPIQELVTSIDLNTDTNNYKVVFLDETLTSSGTVLYTDIVNKTNNSGTTQNNEPEEPEQTYSCTTQPSYTNANFTVGTPNQENQIWQNTSNTDACFYECINGYTGTQCDVSPVLTALTITQNLCTGNGQIIYTDLNGTEIGRVDNTGTTTSGNPGNLNCTGHIAVCSGNEAGYVLQACNVGSTTVGSTDNSASYGNLHQWGNNWGGFSNATISTTRPSCTIDSTFNHNSFVTGNPDWCIEQTDNIWGNETNSFTARRGPCDEGYHIPSQPEWGAIITSWDGGINGINLSNALKLPFAGRRSYDDGNMFNQNDSGFYWSYSPTSIYAYSLFLNNSSNVNPSSYSTRAFGFSVRCFKN